MIKLEICLGGVCFVKGSLDVLLKFKELIDKNGISKKVELTGRFCVGKCYTKFKGVNIRLNDMPYNVTIDQVEDFFTKEILSLI